MRILWITYAAIGAAAKTIEGNVTQSGTWIDAAMKELLKAHPDVELAIAAISSFSCKIREPENGVLFYGVSGIKRVMGKPSRRRPAQWETLFRDFQPDLIQVWGTEYAAGLDIVQAAGDIPVLFYIQGVAQAIQMYPNGGIPGGEFRRRLSFIEWPKLIRYRKMQKQMEAQSRIEREMTARALGVITDNDWCSSFFAGGRQKVFRHVLPLNQAFQNRTHDFSRAQKHTITCCAGTGPHKGLHILIKALAEVKKEFPDVTLYIPGNMEYRNPQWIFRPPYVSYLQQLIQNLELRDNVVFCGRLSPEEMAERVNASELFVLSSCIENHSATLREAMYMGMPCVSSLVGSVQEFVKYGENGLTFRYPEVTQLAEHIRRLFSDGGLRERLGRRAYETVRQRFPQDGQEHKTLYEIYREAGCKA